MPTPAKTLILPILPKILNVLFITASSVDRAAIVINEQ